MGEQDVAGRRLLRQTRPYMASGDRCGLAACLIVEWSPECLALLVEHEDAEVVEAAVIGLELIGDMGCCESVARALHREEAVIVSAAEDALWSIWMRVGGAAGQGVLSRIAESIRACEMENVVAMLTALIREQPTYAEAYHQRSQAYYLADSFEEALRDARRAFELNRWHFGALANQAHALVAMGRFREALEAYREVLKLHPRMSGIRESVGHLRRRLVPVGA